MNSNTSSEHSSAESKPIRLDQFLKVAGVADTGGQAKHMIQSGEVTVNGEVETRRGRKLAAGDVIVAADEEFVIEEA